LLAHIAKSGVSSTLERIFKASGHTFKQLKVEFVGSTAGILFEKNGTEVTSATVLFPFLDETKDVSKSLFNNFIGYALHELGHAWFTDNDPWDRAVRKYGQVLGDIINGLEDPRIERMVYESGYAPNARFLFEHLVNSVLDKNGYVKGDDVQNIPFVLAVEGRRLNGYQINMPSPVDQSPYASEIRWALAEAQKQTDTKGIVKVALELLQKLTTDAPSQPPSQPTEGQPTDGEGDGEGEEGKENEGEKPSGKGKGRAKFDPLQTGTKKVEPSEFIKGEVKTSARMKNMNKGRVVGQPQFASFTWR